MKALRIVIALAALACPAASHAQGTQRGFGVVLLLGDTKTPSGGDGVPDTPGVRKALDEVKEFLPYKSYSVLDTLWMRSGSTRMQGLGDQDYEVEITADRSVARAVHPNADMLNVIFKLQEVGAALNSANEEHEQYARSVELADLQGQLASTLARFGERYPKVVELNAHIAQLEKQVRLMRSRAQINARFDLAIGDTVVVGTSKVAGDKGLVVLLTAIPAKPAGPAPK